MNSHQFHSNETPQDPDRSRATTGEFTLALLQAFLRTGYYQPDHPEAKKAKNCLPAKFRELVGMTGEITFMRVEEADGEAISIEGVAEKSLRLYDIMQRGMAATYLPRFIQFMERKELVCFSMSSRMGKDELTRFIDVMSEPLHAEMKGLKTREQFIKILKLHSISNISFVFADDMIAARTALPWRTRVALSRLKKDIHLLPLLRTMTAAELHDVKQQILVDILRPLTAPELVYALLLNLDLAATTLLAEDDAERTAFALLNDRMVCAIGTLFIKDLLGAGRGFPSHISRAKSLRLLKLLCYQLGRRNDQKANAMLEVMYKKGIISVDDLPAPLRRRMHLIRHIETYLANPLRFLSALDTCHDLSNYQNRSQVMADFVTLLLEYGRINEAADILALLNRHVAEGSQRSPIAMQKRTEIVLGQAPTLAVTLFHKSTKEQRTTLGTLFHLFGNGAIPHLQQILIESTELWHSKQAAETLLAMGKKAVESLISTADGNMLNDTSLTVVIRLLKDRELGESKSAAVQLMSKCVRSSCPSVVFEALAGLAKLQPQGHFELFNSHLSVPDVHIRKIAICGLGACGDRRAFSILTALIEKGERLGGNEHVELAGAAIEALGALLNCCHEAYEPALAYLADMVDRYCASFSWKQLFQGGAQQPAALAIALTNTFGRQRIPCASRHLQKLAHHRNPDVAHRAAGFKRTVLISPDLTGLSGSL